MSTSTQRAIMATRQPKPANVRPCARITTPEQGHNAEKQGWDAMNMLL